MRTVLEPGSYLVHDTVDDPDRSLSVWRHSASSERDTIVVGWTGKLTAARKGERNVTTFVRHHEGFDTFRYRVLRISVQQRRALEMAAVHGVFYPHARRLLKELTDGQSAG